jgi:hypothetical protein
MNHFKKLLFSSKIDLILKKMRSKIQKVLFERFLPFKRLRGKNSPFSRISQLSAFITSFFVDFVDFPS